MADDKKKTKTDEIEHAKLVENLKKRVHWHEQKKSMVENLLTLNDLQINKDHLRGLLAKYDGYAYDIMKFTNQNPQKMMDAVIKRQDFTDNQIVNDFLADRKSLTPEKALEFFAETPLREDVLAQALIECDIDGALRTALKAQESLKKLGVKPNSKETESQQRLTAAIQLRSRHSDFESRMGIRPKKEVQKAQSDTTRVVNAPINERE